MRKETLFQMNRFYLIIALIISLILPLITIHYTVITAENLSDEAVTTNVLQDTNTGSGRFPVILTTIYFTGVFIFFIRIFWQFILLISVISQNGIRVINETKIVHNTKFHMPFSFLNFIFINPENMCENEVIDIIAHEKVHIREKHWIDLLVVELISIILWFNPFIWFFERSIKQNHEYLADKGVIAQGFNVNRYHSVLINRLMGMEVIGITNNLNYSLNTNRLKMMKKQKTSKIKALHLIWVLPVVLTLLAAFAQPVYKEILINETNSIGEKVNIIVVVFDKDGNPLEGAVAFIKGSDKKTKTNDKGIFEMEVSKTDIIVIKYEGYEKSVIYMEKVVAKNPDSESYKFKLMLNKEGESFTNDKMNEQEIKELETKLKELAIKQKELEFKKQELIQKEKEIDAEVLKKEKEKLEQERFMIENKKKELQKKLQYLKSN